MKCLAIIPARAGSKRIFRKNIKNFVGKPILSRVIETAIESEVFSDVLVSTDDKEISEISQRSGATVPFMRSSKNSDDKATLTDVLKEVLDYLIENKIYYEYICLILPTAVFINRDILKETQLKFINGDYNSLVPVVRYSHPIQRALKNNNGRLEFEREDFKYTRTQDLEPYYHDSGQFYWIDVEKFKGNSEIFNSNTGFFELEEKLVQDIDTIEDWELAELKYKVINDL